MLGLARSEKSAKDLKSLGADVLMGDLNNLESLREGARKTDGVIHTAFNTAFAENDTFAKLRHNSEHDAVVMKAMGEALKGTNRPLIITTGTALLKPGELSHESGSIAYPPEKFPRVLCEMGADEVAAMGVRIGVVRLSPTVHGKHDQGFIPLLIKTAREKGYSAYIGDGLNRWSAVHRTDAAAVFRLALEHTTCGQRFHAAAESAIAFRDIAYAIGRGLNLPTHSIAAEGAGEHFGWFQFFAGLDAPASSEVTREKLSWRPTGPSLMRDLEDGHYFDDANKT